MVSRLEPAQLEIPKAPAKAISTLAQDQHFPRENHSTFPNALANLHPIIQSSRHHSILFLVPSPPGLHSPNPTLAEPQSERPAAEQTAAAASGQYTSQPEARPATQYTASTDSRPSNISSSNTPQPDYGLNPAVPTPTQPQPQQPQTQPQPPPPSTARPPPGPYPEYLTRQPQYHHAPHTQPGGAADPSIAASSPTYPPPYSPYNPQGHEMAQYQGHPPPQMYGRPDWPPHQYGQPPHGLPGPYSSPGTTVGSASPAATAGPRPGQVYSFVPIPGAQQHKRPRRRYEEIERMYKCGWNGCEKAYGTLNHLNAHVTMQSHGAKRTPEEFKEIRKEWKARKKEEENQRKAAEERERAAAQASQQVDGNAPTDPSQAAQPASYPTSVRPQLPPIGYQSADGQVPAQYGASTGAGLVYPPSNGQMAAPYPPANYPHSPYGQGNQVYQPRE
ncbi:conserved hypothetical protein [Histoplasma capsulatum G186AR]|uniref:C2H2-type domain-containing protein n=1 Tax=Ajellomyces capsulatus (strain G186AR / H82 / ATCC MYA-2454 / RMSCC 2432) TaxID=447093 RepID=C0NXB1_AJECG|nr:uncharacterized protein HCBG_08103 [Histoplasma capsulatum G186AR]EEH03977.1 conserved hypothetical protein [Histoplasma capsulatum G186AR]